MKLVKPKKNLGQHFLTDLNIAQRIADTVDACPDIPVLEIGPGMGVLTQYLVEKPREVKAVEIDNESVCILVREVSYPTREYLGRRFPTYAPRRNFRWQTVCAYRQLSLRYFVTDILQNA